MRISDWSSDVCSSDLDDMLAARAELSAGRIFEHFPIHGENVESDLGPGEIWHHDNIVDWTAQLLIAHSGEILFGTNAAAFGILTVRHRRYIPQAPEADRKSTRLNSSH